MHDEAEWLARCRGGDPTAWTWLVETHARLVGTLILRTLGHGSRAREHVDDLAQDTFLRAFRGLDGFDGRSRLSTWIGSIAVRVALDAARRARRRIATIAEEEAPEPVADGDLEAEVAQDEQDRRLRAAIDRLPDRYRLPLVYTAIDGLDYDAVAELLHMPVGTVKTNVFRAKALLRERLEMSHEQARA